MWDIHRSKILLLALQTQHISSIRYLLKYTFIINSVAECTIPPKNSVCNSGMRYHCSLYGTGPQTQDFVHTKLHLQLWQIPNVMTKNSNKWWVSLASDTFKFLPGNTWAIAHQKIEKSQLNQRLCVGIWMKRQGGPQMKTEAWTGTG